MSLHLSEPQLSQLTAMDDIIYRQDLGHTAPKYGMLVMEKTAVPLLSPSSPEQVSDLGKLLDVLPLLSHS